MPNVYGDGSNPNSPHRIGPGEAGYPLLSFSWPRSLARWMVVGGLACLVLLSYALSLRAGLPTGPASLLGLAYALVGTGCFLCALTLYRRKRRARALYRLGHLHTLLQWHFGYALLGLVLLALHSFGRMDPHFSGTYALVALVALVGSGYLGRGLERLLPLLIAREMDEALGDSGLPPRVAARVVPPPPGVGWGSASVQAGETPAMRRIAFYRSLLLGWRRGHRALALLACGCIAWHLAFVCEMYLTGRLPVP